MSSNPAMMKKQKRRHYRHKGKEKIKKPGRLQLLAHPLNGIDPEALKVAILAMAKREIEEFPKLVETMLAQLRQKYPPMLISTVSAYSLQAGVSSDGKFKMLSPDMFQHHIEVMQALAMTLSSEEWGSDPITFADVETAMETLREMAHSFHYRRFKALEEEREPDAHAVLALQEKLRTYTQAVRNWGSYSQVLRISTELYAPLDEFLKAKKGFSASDLIAAGQHMVKILQDRANDRLRWMGRVVREHNVRRIVRTYYKYHPTIERNPDDFIKTIPPNATRENVLALIMQHADLLIEQTMTFVAEDISIAAGLTAGVMRRVLNDLSKIPGDLKAQNPEHFFMGNPIWEFPVINLGDRYLCVIPQAIFSHIHRIMHRVAKEADVLPQLESRRSRYLEEKVAHLLASSFATGTLRNNTRWRLDQVEYETDHLLLIDKIALIVEDKSHSLTERGLRGAPERVREHVRDLLESPSEQSARLERVILRAKSNDGEAIASLAPFNLPFSEVERIIRINITLDDLTVLSSEEDELKATGWIKPELVLAPTMTLADLETVIDILGGPAFLLHYFSERQRVQSEGHVFADEIDFLGVYLDTGLNMGDLREQNLRIALTGASEPIDNYYNGLDANIEMLKPRPKLSPYFANLVTAMEERAFPAWSLVTMDLLRSATFKEQLKIEKALIQLKSKVEKNWEDPKHECCLVIGSHPLKDTSLLVFVYPPQLAEQRKDRAAAMAAQVLDKGTSKRCVMILRDTSHWMDPYNSVFILGSENMADVPTPASQASVS